jgi:hypothetical protein
MRAEYLRTVSMIAFTGQQHTRGRGNAPGILGILLAEDGGRRDALCGNEGCRESLVDAQENGASFRQTSNLLHGETNAAISPRKPRVDISDVDHDSRSKFETCLRRVVDRVLRAGYR